MAWKGSPTAVTGCPIPSLGVPPEKSPRSICAWAAEVSWYSSNSTTRYADRTRSHTAGTSCARRAAMAIWSANSTTPRRCLSRW